MRAAIFVLMTGLAIPSAVTEAHEPPKGWSFAGVTRATSANVQARVSGYLMRVAVKEGDTVKKGDRLVEIDQRSYQLDRDAAKARVKLAEAKLKKAQITADSAKRLQEQTIISPEELALRMATKAEAVAMLRGAQVELERAELYLSWTRITAPFDGQVSRVQVSEGGLVTAGNPQLLRVVSMDPLHVSFNVPEAILLQLRRQGLIEPDDFKVSVGYAGEEGYSHAAKLDSVGAEVASLTGAVRCRATLANPKGILSPGMSAMVHLTPASE